ncbi:MAG: TRAP transporter substrate-binding protein [Nannocystaceae bacterium]|nr:TRAP transporter substrate-binding protein [bacterium]
MSTKKLQTSRRTLLKGAGASAAIAPFFIGRSANAADPEWTLKCATVAPGDTPWGHLARNLGKLVTKRTDGRVKIKVFLGGALGNEQSVVEQTGAGKIAIFAGSFGGMSKIVPELSALELPYIVKSAKQGRKVLAANRQIIHDILWDRGFKLWFFSENGTQDIGSTRAIESPSDMKGLKIRTLESDVHIDFVKAAGASASPMGVTEVLPSLQTGVIDGFTNTKIFGTAAGWTSAITHWTVSAHCWQPALVAMSRKVYETLPKEITEAISGEDEELVKLQTRTNRRLDAMKPQLLQNIKDLGIEVIEPDLAPWRKLAGGVHGKFEKATTKQGKALLKGIKKAT